MRRFLSNAYTPSSQRSEHKVLRPKQCRMSDKHFELLWFLRANKNQTLFVFLENSFAVNNDLIIVILTKRIAESANCEKKTMVL